jgi:hypothetical protein
MAPRRSFRSGLLAAGALMVAGIFLPVQPAGAQVSLNFNFGAPGYNLGYWAPSPYYARYYSRQLYAQYVMWYYYPSLYYRYYPAPPPPSPYGIPRPPPPPYGAPPPPPPPRFFAGLRAPRPEFYRGAPHLRPGGPIPHWRPSFRPPQDEYRHGRDGGPYRHGPGPQGYDRRGYDAHGHGPGGPGPGRPGYDHGGPNRQGPDHGGPGHDGPDHGGPYHGGPDHGGPGGPRG